MVMTLAPLSLCLMLPLISLLFILGSNEESLCDCDQFSRVMFDFNSPMKVIGGGFFTRESFGGASFGLGTSEGNRDTYTSSVSKFLLEGTGKNGDFSRCLGVGSRLRSRKSSSLILAFMICYGMEITCCLLINS